MTGTDIKMWMPILGRSLTGEPGERPSAEVINQFVKAANADLLKQFEAAQAAFDEHCKVSWDRDHPIQQEFDAALLAEWKRVYPRRKFTVTKAMALPNYDAIRDPFTERAKAAHDVRQAKRDELDKQLDELADQIVIVDGMRVADKTQWTLTETVSEYSYSTQGFGAIKYAHEAAEGYAEKYRHYGIEAEVRSIRQPAFTPGGQGHTEFEVRVGATPLAVAIVQRKPDVPLRDWLKSCWKRGVNPRVYSPMLPAGLEEQLGIDYFGNDKR